MLQSKAAAGGKLEGNQLEKLSRSKAIAEQHRACLEERQQLLVVADVATRAKFGACTNCGREGHTDANCPRPKSKQAAGAAAAGRKQLPRRDKTFKERSSTATHRTSIARASKGLTSTASSACADAKGQRKLPRDHARTRGIFLDGSSGAAGTIVASSPSSSQKQKTSCSACTFLNDSRMSACEMCGTALSAKDGHVSVTQSMRRSESDGMRDRDDRGSDRSRSARSKDKAKKKVPLFLQGRKMRRDLSPPPTTNSLAELQVREKLADVERTRKKLTKAIEQVTLLRKKHLAKEILEANQLDKIKRYSTMIIELSELDEKVRTAMRHTFECVTLEL